MFCAWSRVYYLLWCFTLMRNEFGLNKYLLSEWMWKLATSYPLFILPHPLYMIVFSQKVDSPLLLYHFDQVFTVCDMWCSWTLPAIIHIFLWLVTFQILVHSPKIHKKLLIGHWEAWQQPIPLQVVLILWPSASPHSHSTTTPLPSLGYLCTEDSYTLASMTSWPHSWPI